MNRGKAKITYAQDTDPRLKRAFINAIEVLSGRGQLTRIYDQLCSEPFEIPRFFTKGLDLAGVRVLCNREREMAIPRQGPLVFIANHPFGIVDGVIMCELASRTRGDFRILINHRLCQDENLNRLFLPISFDETRAAIKLNISTKQAAEQLLKAGGTLVIFPGGGVATRTRLGFGKLQELPWTTFAAKLIKRSRATVVPVYFHGENSFFFHFVSNLSMDLRLAFFIREVTRGLNKPCRLVLGEPISWDEMAGHEHRQDLTDFLQHKVEALASVSLDETQGAKNPADQPAAFTGTAAGFPHSTGTGPATGIEPLTGTAQFNNTEPATGSRQTADLGPLASSQLASDSKQGSEDELEQGRPR